MRRRERSLRLWRHRRDLPCRRLARINASVEGAICFVFGSRCGEAVEVARCESAHGKRPIPFSSVWARNGQFLGLFQMGSSERATFGHGSTPLAQARAAYRYFVASGRDWSPWSCKP